MLLFCGDMKGEAYYACDYYSSREKSFIFSINLFREISFSILRKSYPVFCDAIQKKTGGKDHTLLCRFANGKFLQHVLYIFLPYSKFLCILLNMEEERIVKHFLQSLQWFVWIPFAYRISGLFQHSRNDGNRRHGKI